MAREDEARNYIEEMRKRGIALYRIADMSPEELMEYMPVDRDLAEAIIELARREVFSRMDRKSRNGKVYRLPHVGKKRAEIMESLGLNIEKIASMTPDELRKLIPNLRRREAEDIIIAAEMHMERKLGERREFRSELLELPYIGVSRAYRLHLAGKGVEDVARMRPEELMAILPDMGRDQAEKAIMAAEMRVESKRTVKVPQRREMRMKRGLVNGNSLVNGRGVVNGLGSRATGRERRGIKPLPVALLAILMISAIVLPYALVSSQSAIVVDGSFGDWSGVRAIPDPYGSADGPLELAKVAIQGDIFVYLKSHADLMERPQGIYVFVDSDGNESTGYRVGNIGADYMARLVGWNTGIEEKHLYRFTSVDQYNWSAFADFGSPRVALGEREMEMEIPVKADNPVIFVVLKNETSEDMSEIPISRGPSAFVKVSVIQDTYDESRPFARIDVNTSGRVRLDLDIKPTGNSSSLKCDAEIRRKSDGELVGKWILQDVVEGRESYYVYVTASGRGTLGIRVIARTPGVNVENTGKSVEIGGASFGVDGSFWEWRSLNGTDDPRDDVAHASPYVHENIDLLEVKRSERFFYFRTAAPVLAGDVVPEVIKKYLPDSDRDTVPDMYDPFPDDFNNDGIPDEESIIEVDGESMPDVDADGVADYPYGEDMWLNTTIPDDFPEPYAGKEVHVYIGPLPKIRVTGNDTFFIYVESSRGYRAPFLPFPAGYMVRVEGRGFQANARLFRYYGGSWHYVKDVPVAFAGDELEGDSAVPGRIFVLSQDWMGQYDMAGTASDAGRITVEKVRFDPALIRAADLVVDGKTVYLNGTQYYGNVSVLNHGKIVVNGTLELHVNSLYVDPTSSITANGTGYPGGAGGNASSTVGQDGSGPGYGLGGVDGGGGGGGGYGGYGGNGGGSGGGAGGAPYGTHDGYDIDMGSGGGGGSAAKLVNRYLSGGDGGNGGGCIKIYATENVTIEGAIYANGEDGESTLGAGGGGGSGGGILIVTVNITITGNISAAGGSGGRGVAGGGGGGGSGGRIKIFYSGNMNISGYINVSGGLPGKSILGNGDGNAGETGDFVPEINVSSPVFTSTLLIAVSAVLAYRRRRRR